MTVAVGAESRPTLSERLPRRRRERGHALLEHGGARVLCTELATHVAPEDRLAEHRRLPQRERLEPRERAELTAAALRVPRDQLAPRRKPFAGGDGRRPERTRRSVRLAVRREQVPDVRARIADRAHLPVQHGLDPRRLVARDHHVAEPEVAVHDCRRHRLGQTALEEAAHLVDIRDRTRAVHLPQLLEPAHLPLGVAPRSREGGERGHRHVCRVDLDERVDQIPAQATPRRLRLETGRQRLRDDVPVEIAHHVERNAENRFVVADGEDLRKAPEPTGAHGELQSRLAHHVVRRGRERRARRATKHEPVVAALEQEGEVRAAAVADSVGVEWSLAELIRVEEALDPVEDDQRLHGAMLCPGDTMPPR